MKKSKSAHLIIGSMLFGLFFGAGNLIFPVHMGQMAGRNVFMATLGFLLTGTGLPFLGIMAMGITDSKNALEFGSRVHKGFGYVMAVLLYLTIGPLFALPRTATVSFEVGLTPLIPQQYASLALAIFTVLFFSTALYFALRPARILDWVGKILNPLFLLFITFLFIRALIDPMGEVSAISPSATYVSAAFSQGFIEGYQTMDALAALAFGSILVEQIKAQGNQSPKEVVGSTFSSGIVTVLLMCVVYGGLSWLGASSLGSMPSSANGGLALAQISRHYLGSFGSIFLTITITIACLKTAIGLITSCSKAFMEMFPQTFDYKTYAFIFAGFSCLVGNIGLTKIIALALPMLMFLYPLATVLIILSFFENYFDKDPIVYQLAMVGAVVVGVVDALNAMPAVISSSPLVEGISSFYRSYIPFFAKGFGWILPAGVGLVVGLAIQKTRKKV